MEQYLQNFKSCRQKEIPFCASECPFQFDIFDFIEKMKRGAFKGAFKTYRNAVGFPMIASSLCDEPCKGVCPRKDFGGAIELGLLEKACIALTTDKSPTDYNLPTKRKRVAVIGAGIAGLACALRLCMKKYEVEIFEKSGRIGGSLWELMEPEIFITDIKEQFKFENYVLHLNTRIQNPEDLDGLGFDAIFAATGDGGSDFGLLSLNGNSSSPPSDEKNCMMYGNTGWFAGGGLIGEDPVHSLANGLFMATVIDNFLKTGKLINPENKQPTRVCIDPAGMKFEKTILPIDHKQYNEGEAQEEALRCMECQCDFCRNDCDLTDYFNKWPLRIRDEIKATTLPGSADVKATPAKRLLSTCNQCGLCKETCPEEIDLGGLILAGRKSMHQQKKAPWVFHDFWLRDMDFANSDRASIARASGYTDSVDSHKTAAGILDSENYSKQEADDINGNGSYAFFPGCQMGASDPVLIEKTYDYLMQKHPDTGLLLRCCGAPAEWSGDEEKHRNEIETIRGLWRELGEPTLILACPTCLKKFQQYMMEIPVVSLYEMMAEWGVDPEPAQIEAESSKQKKVYSIFDACAARGEEPMKKAVRRLAEASGIPLEPLPENDVMARCCGYGGQPGIANPEYTQFVAKKRTAESVNPYITYCINCRDIFMEAGKESLHILELLFGGEKVSNRLATVTERRENRIQLKKRLLKKYWNENMEEIKRSNEIKLNISEELLSKLNQERILEEDLGEVIAFCERTGRKVWLPEKEAYSGYHEQGFMTYWVEYRKANEENSFELVNAYAHRMKIELEAVWNGRKTDTDL